MKNPYLIFTAVLVILLTFFYFYQVDLFQAEIISNGDSITRDVSFKTFFETKMLPEDYSTKPTLQGWLLLAAIFIGLPTMLAFRVTLKRYPRRGEK